MYNTKESIKVYVPVEVSFDEKGRMYPRRIHWEDGQAYDVDRILDVRPAYAARAGGQGDRYTIIVRQQERQLYFERSASLTGDHIGRWFIERKQA